MRMTVEDRFWAKVDKSGDCWIWTAGVHHASGFGEFSLLGQKAYAHRVSYEIVNGEIPQGMTVNQTCRNRVCVKPGHLLASEGRMTATKKTCKRGHDQTAEGARSPGNGCLACKRTRAKEQAAALPPKPEKYAAIVPEAMIAELKSLQKLSSRTGRATPLGHEFRRAGDMLAELAVEAIAEYGVTVTSLSRQMGLTDHAMRHFLMRRGAIEATPGVKRLGVAYRNLSNVGQPKIQECKRGHQQTSETRNRHGQCRPCMAFRKKAAYHAKA